MLMKSKFFNNKATALCMFGILLLVSIQTSNSERVFKAHRGLQYDKEGSAFGTQKNKFDFLAKAFPTPTGSGRTKLPKRLSRNVVVLKLVSTTKEQIEEIIFKRKAGAVLILIPKNVEKYPQKVLEEWKGIEQWLMTEKIPTSLYFAVTNDELEATYERLSGDANGQNEEFRIVSKVALPKKKIVPKLSNIQGWLSGASLSGEVDADTLGTVAIVAHYDSFGVAPGLAHGGDSNGSGVAALLEIARLFSGLYGSDDAKAPYNIVFVLSAAGHINYSGSREWLANSDVQLLDSIEFALCIDSIGMGDKVFMHLSKPRKSKAIKKVLNAFSVAAKRVGVDFETVHKKINLVEPQLSWEHEQFALRQIVSATVSRFATPSSDSFARASIFDTPASIDYSALNRNIRFISEALSVYMYEPVQRVSGTTMQTVIHQALDSDKNYVKAWLESFGRNARGLLGDTDAGDSIIPDLQNGLGQYVEDTGLQSFTVEETDVTPYVFYGPLHVDMSIFLVKPVRFDVIFTALTTTYLLLLHTYFRGFSSLTSLFKS